MELQLDDLIGKIHKEGVLEANKQAEAIITKAKEQAEKILEEAYQRSHRMRQESEKEWKRTEEAGRSTLRQAARDILIAVERELKSLMSKVIENKASQVMTPERIAEFIKLVLPSFLKENKKGVLLISEDKISEYEESLRNALSEYITSEKITIKPFASSQKGFKLQEERGVVSYDFTLSSISDVLSGYINPRFAFMLHDEKSSVQS